MSASDPNLGFAGLGAKGEPLCRALAEHGGRPVIAYDLRVEPLGRLGRHGVEGVASLEKLVARADLVFLALPGETALRAVIEGPGGFLERGRAGQIVVDLAPSPLALTKDLGRVLAQRQIDFLDAPVARPVGKGSAGAIAVGGDPEAYERARNYLDCLGYSVSLCGGIGAGQTVRLLNAMVLLETAASLAGALAIGRRAGLGNEALKAGLATGAADAFTLRSHAMGTLLGEDYGEEPFSGEQALEDLDQALTLARETGIAAPAAEAAAGLLRKSGETGSPANYFAALLEAIEEEER
ncbi:MAG: NAD(P)-dependent oxidoreductase [Alphaproteobacteria bacterium]